MRQLEGKVAIVTGAARGLGAGTAFAFSEEGARVLLADVAEEGLAETERRITASGGLASSVRLDVTDPEGWDRAIAAALGWTGRIDVLVNNAGVVDRRGLTDIDLEAWHRVFAVNAFGALLGIRACAPLMRGQGFGSIINVASIAALQGFEFPVYAASKWALRGLSKSAALELGPMGIRVNVLCPGVVETDINRGQPYIGAMARRIPLKRTGRPVDVAAAATFLASDAAAYVTGQELVVDGGFTAGWRTRESYTEPS